MDKMGIHYNVWIVLLSFALAATAAYSALNLISQVPRSFGKVRRLWLISGACTRQWHMVDTLCRDYGEPFSF